MCFFIVTSTNEKEDIYVWSYMKFKSITQKLSQRKKRQNAYTPTLPKKTHQTKGPVTQSTLIIKERNNTPLTLI